MHLFVEWLNILCKAMILPFSLNVCQDLRDACLHKKPLRAKIDFSFAHDMS